MPTENSDVIHLDTRDERKALDRLWEGVYKHKKVVRQQIQEDITRDDLNHYTVFEHIQSLADQTGLGYDKIKQGLRELAPSTDEPARNAYSAALNKLFETENRGTGQSYRGHKRGPARRRGNMAIRTIPTDVYVSIIGWLAEKLPATTVALPPPPAPERPKPITKPEDRYADLDGHFMQALAQGMHADLESLQDKSFVPLFRAILKDTRVIDFAGADPKFHDSKPISGYMVAAFNPAVTGMEKKQRDALKITGKKTAYGHEINRKLSFVFKNEDAKTHVLTTDDVFQIGYVLRDLNKLDHLQEHLGFRLLPEKADIPPHMINFLLADQKMAQATAAKPTAARQIGNITVKVRAVPPRHDLVAEYGQRLEITLTDGGQQRILPLTIPEGQSADALLDSVAARMGRLKQELRTTLKMGQTIQELANQRGHH